MKPYKITVELNLEKIIAETKEVAQALNDFSEDLEQIQKKYTDDKAESEEKK